MFQVKEQQYLFLLFLFETLIIKDKPVSTMSNLPWCPHLTDTLKLKNYG